MPQWRSKKGSNGKTQHFQVKNKGYFRGKVGNSKITLVLDNPISAETSVMSAQRDFSMISDPKKKLQIKRALVFASNQAKNQGNMEVYSIYRKAYKQMVIPPKSGGKNSFIDRLRPLAKQIEEQLNSTKEVAKENYAKHVSPTDKKLGGKNFNNNKKNIILNGKIFKYKTTYKNKKDAQEHGLSMESGYYRIIKSKDGYDYYENHYYEA